MAYVLIVKGYCYGSRKDRRNKYTASDIRACSRRAQKLVRVVIRRKEAGVKVTGLREPFRWSVRPLYTRTQRKWSNRTNTRTYLYHAITLANLFASSVQSII